jgi:hypothetical protein
MKSPRRWPSASGSCSMRRPAKSRRSPKVVSRLHFSSNFSASCLSWSTDEPTIVWFLVSGKLG